MKGKIHIFDGKTAPLKHFEMEFLMVMRHFSLDYALDGEKRKILFADKTIGREYLHAHYGQTKIAKHIAVWRLNSSVLKTDADERFLLYEVASTWLENDRLFPSHRDSKSEGAPKLTSSQRSASGKQRRRSSTWRGLLAALDEVGIPVREQFICVYFVYNLLLGL